MVMAHYCASRSAGDRARALDYLVKPATRGGMIETHKVLLSMQNRSGRRRRMFATTRCPPSGWLPPSSALRRCLPKVRKSSAAGRAVSNATRRIVAGGGLGPLAGDAQVLARKRRTRKRRRSLAAQAVRLAPERVGAPCTPRDCRSSSAPKLAISERVAKAPARGQGCFSVRSSREPTPAAARRGVDLPRPRGRACCRDARSS